MKILIDILHPAHVHVFRNFIKEMTAKGNIIKVTARKKDVTLRLLDAYHISSTKISTISKKKVGLAVELISRTFNLFKIVKRFKPDLLLGCMGPSIVLAGKLLKIPTIVLYNNETATTVNRWVQPNATAYLTSESYSAKVNGNHITHPSYHELAYLHPNHFILNKNTAKKFNLKKPFAIIRLVSWQSSHDIGAKGIRNPLQLVQELEKHLMVYITSEKPLPQKFEKYRLSIPPERLHDVLAHAAVCVGESATLAAEAACLGVPAVYIANTRRGYTDELENKFGLVFNFESQEAGTKKAIEIINQKDKEKHFKKKQKEMLKERIDLTSWLISFIEQKGWTRTKNYPKK